MPNALRSPSPHNFVAKFLPSCLAAHISISVVYVSLLMTPLLSGSGGVQNGGAGGKMYCILLNPHRSRHANAVKCFVLSQPLSPLLHADPFYTELFILNDIKEGLLPVTARFSWEKLLNRF